MSGGRGTIPASEHYRPAPTHARSCATCSFYGAGTVDQCGRFDVAVQGDRLCDAWQDGFVPASVAPAKTVVSNARVTALESTDGDNPVEGAIPAEVHYREADAPDVSCATCQYFANARCTYFDAPVSPSAVCDKWLPIESDHSMTAAAPKSAPAAKVVPVGLHNEVLKKTQARVDALEPKLAAVIQPILEEAGEQAARTFQSRVTNHLTASLARQADRDALGRVGLEEGRALLASLALTAAADITPVSAMISLYPRPDEAKAIAEQGGERPEDIHVTLVYLGQPDPDTIDAVRTALTTVAGTHPPLEGTVGGVGAFQDQGNGTPAIGLPDVPGLVELRQAVCEAVLEADADYSRLHGYQPHLTVAYRPDSIAPPDTATLGAPLHFDSLKLVQGNAVISDFPLTGSRQLTAAGNEDGVPAQPPQWTSPAPDELLDVPALVATITAKTAAIRKAFVESVMSPSLEAAGLSWDVSNPLTAKVLAQSGSQIKEISLTTQANVQAIIATSYEQGLSVDDAAKAIRVAMKQASKARATTIARTELVGASNGGSLAAAQIVSQATESNYTKTWMTAPGALHPRHEDYDDLDGQTVGLEDYFQVGDAQLLYPGDENGDPGETINCRCALSYSEGAVEYPGVDD